MGHVFTFELSLDPAFEVGTGRRRNSAPSVVENNQRMLSVFAIGTQNRHRIVATAGIPPRMYRNILRDRPDTQGTGAIQ